MLSRMSLLTVAYDAWTVTVVSRSTRVVAKVRMGEVKVDRKIH
jgi:hypothetical protein